MGEAAGRGCAPGVGWDEWQARGSRGAGLGFGGVGGAEVAEVGCLG